MLVILRALLEGHLSRLEAHLRNERGTLIEIIRADKRARHRLIVINVVIDWSI
jgi:hypothetical protein